MKPSLASILLVFALFAVAGGVYAATPPLALNEARGVQQDSAATKAILTTLRQYFQGHASGDPKVMRQAFLASAHIEGIREGKFTSWTVDEYCARFNGKPAADESKRVRTVDNIDVNGDAAMARATLDHGATAFTDYFVLLKVGGQWKIANKVYASYRKPDEKR